MDRFAAAASYADECADHLPKMAAKKWDSATTIHFVRQYAKHTCLWDIGHPNYKNRAARDAAVLDIARNMNMSDLRPNDVKCKIRIIRNTYINEIKKIREKKQAGGKRSNYVCSIPWFETADKFLRKVVRKKKYPASLVSLDDGDSLDLDFGPAAASASSDVAAAAESLHYQPDLKHFHQHYAFDSDSELTMDLNAARCIKQEIEATSEDDVSLLSADRASPVTITTTPTLALPVTYSETETLSPSAYSYSNRSNCDSPSLALPSSKMVARESSAFGGNGGSGGTRSLFRANANQPPTQPLITSTDDVFVENRWPTEPNEFDVFAKNVALQLKQLPLESALKVQARIHDILIAERLNVIQSTKRNELAARSVEDGESGENR